MPVDIERLTQVLVDYETTEWYDPRGAGMARALVGEIPALIAEIERLRGALKWYADPDNYEPDTHAPATTRFGGAIVDYDIGQRAQIALQE